MFLFVFSLTQTAEMTAVPVCRVENPVKVTGHTMRMSSLGINS